MLNHNIKISYILSVFMIRFRYFHLVSGPIDLQRCVPCGESMCYPGRKVDITGWKLSLPCNYLHYWQYRRGIKMKNKLTMTERTCTETGMSVGVHWVSVCCASVEKVKGRLVLGCITSILHCLKPKQNLTEEKNKKTKWTNNQTKTIPTYLSLTPGN